MTPLEHYQEAERLLEQNAKRVKREAKDGALEASSMAYMQFLVDTAQVHATLASVPYSPPITPRSTP